MPVDTLLQELTAFLGSPTAARICRQYGAQSVDALGELYLRLTVSARQPIRNPKAWMRKSASGLLSNFLRAEYRQLGQTLEVRS